MLYTKLSKKTKYNSAPPYVVEAFHGRIGVLIEMYNESRASKKSSQKIIDREISRLKGVNGVIPNTIKDLLNKNGLKY